MFEIGPRVMAELLIRKQRLLISYDEQSKHFQVRVETTYNDHGFSKDVMFSLEGWKDRSYSNMIILSASNDVRIMMDDYRKDSLLKDDGNE
jgi:hypothetical protein